MASPISGTVHIPTIYQDGNQFSVRLNRSELRPGRRQTVRKLLQDDQHALSQGCASGLQLRAKAGLLFVWQYQQDTALADR